MKNQAHFASIDFETANHSRVSICAAGMAIFEAGILTESPYWLVRPPKGHGWFRNEFSEVHGLTHLDVLDAPEFPAIAPELLPRLTNAELVVAHNAEFDIGHLRETLDYFGLTCPEFDYVCTCQLARRIWPDLPNHKLSTLAAYIGLEFHHHQAQSDAEAAGCVLLAMMREWGARTVTELAKGTRAAVKIFAGKAVPVAVATGCEEFNGELQNHCCGEIAKRTNATTKRSLYWKSN